MAFLIKRLLAGLTYRDVPRSHDRSPELECVVLPARQRAGNGHKPPVRIFLGTEAAQYRAERVFVWSVAKVRDPSRRYEIYLLKDLPGFDRRWWLTGFTAYRFAIPELAGGTGRAIYNDTDQIYLTDPAELFDTPMEGCGYLSTSVRDTSVMLIDCARMIRVWTLDGARQLPRKQLEAKARAIPGLWGPLDAAWNARDGEYTAGHSRLVHFTTLQTQPWLPFPGDYVYWPNPVGPLWADLERSADQAGYQLFDASNPSSAYRNLQRRLCSPATRSGGPSKAVVPGETSESREILRLLQQAEARSVLDFGFASALCEEAGNRDEQEQLWSVERSDPGQYRWDKRTEQDYDAVLCRHALEVIPDEDLPWLIEKLFTLSRCVLHAIVDDFDPNKRLPDGSFLEVAPRSAARWLFCFEQASRLHPQVHWRLVLSTRDAAGRRIWQIRVGGRLVDGPPRIWVLAHGKPGHNTQAIGLAEALGWPFEVKLLQTLPAAFLARRLIHRLGLPIPHGLTLAGELRPPWPDVVIAAGWFPSRIARWLRRENPAMRSVLLGRKSGPAEAADLLIGCAHFGMPLAANRIETLLPAHPVSGERLEGETARRPELLAGQPRPRVVALVGGDSKHSLLDTQGAYRLGKELRAFAQAAGGSAFAVTSRRTSARAADALKVGIGGPGQVHEWRKDQSDNPYFGYLAAADVLVVTGDSESMLAEAAATDKPLFIYPIAEPLRLWDRFSCWVARQARAQPLNRRGSVRPQRGLEYLCARLIDKAWVLPPRQTEALYQALLERGAAQMFGAQLELRPRRPLRETEELAQRVRAALGLQDPAPWQQPLEVAQPQREVGGSFADEGQTEPAS